MTRTSDGGASSRGLKRAPRVAGPFQGRRLGAISTDLTVHDLSLTGCLIESLHDEPVGRRMTLEIDLPSEATVRLDAESVNIRPNFGFAVKFLEMTPQVRVHLARTVFTRLTKAKSAQ